MDGSIITATDLPVGGVKVDEKYNDGFAPVRGPDNGPLVIQNPTDVKYIIQFTASTTAGTILLASPVLEDVSIYWDDGKSHLLSYVFITKAY